MTPEATQQPRCVSDFTLILVAPEQSLYEAFVSAFRELLRVQVSPGYFENLPAFDCMVSAANSFGLMDGGVDGDITRFFGYPLMQRVQQRILDEFLGEQNVGTSIIVETGHPSHPFLAHTPTMRSPMEISRTDNVYQAMWAMLLAVRQHNRVSPRPIRLVACPGLGTGTGKVPHAEAARQTALAYRHFTHPPAEIDWSLSFDRQSAIRYGGDLGFNFPPEGSPTRRTQSKTQDASGLPA